MTETITKQINYSSTIQIGIDPGKHTGLAVADLARTEAPVLELYNLNFWAAIDFILGKYVPADLRQIVIERTDTTASFVPMSPAERGKRSFTKDEAQSLARRAHKMGGNVGGVNMQADLMIERFVDYGFFVNAVKPTGFGKGKKGPRQELQLRQFKMATGWTGKSNDHTRDAAILSILR